MARKNIFDVQTELCDTSEGPVPVPSFYQDGAAATAFFMCEYDKVEATLQGTGLLPCRMQNGKALVGLGFFDYRDTSFGSYHESTLMIAVYPLSGKKPWNMSLEFLRKADRRTFGFYHLDLPLTQALPWAAGRELWGLNKFLTDIPFTCTGDTFEGSVLAPDTGDNIFTIRGPFGRGLSMPAANVVFYSNHQDTILKTVCISNYSCKMTGGKSVEVTIGPARHLMAEHLEGLGLRELRPVMLQTTDQLRFRQNTSTSAGSWKSPPPPYT